GQPTFTWIKYADTATGLGMSDDPAGKRYIGLAFNKLVQLESSNASDYQWALFEGPEGPAGLDGAKGDQGPQGVRGPAGADGQSLFTWLKYADTPTTGMSDSPTGKAYIGLAYNKTTATESSTYSDYQWTLVKGAPG